MIVNVSEMQEICQTAQVKLIVMERPKWADGLEAKKGCILTAWSVIVLLYIDKYILITG